MAITTDEASGAPGSLGVRDVDGLKISYRIATTDELVLDTEYGSTRFVPEGFHIPEDGTILDAGAHIGIFAALAARLVPRGAVHALEPSSDNFGLLEKNLRDNSISNAHAHKLALAGSNGSLRLYHAPGSVGHSFYFNPDWNDQTPEPRAAQAAPLDEYEEVPTQVLAEFKEAHGIDEIHFLKMNIEGAEYDVLLGATDETVRSIRGMQIELHPENEGRAEQLIDRLTRLGYTTEFVPTDNPAVKGWLTAIREPGAWRG